MKKILLVITSLAFLLGASVGFADLKIGVVDLNKVLAKDPQVKTLQTQLKKQFNPRNQELIKAQKDLQADVAKYNTDSSKKLKGDALKQEQQKLLVKQKKLQTMRTAFQRDLIKAQNQSMQTVLKKVESVVNKIATDQKYNLILTKTSTAYSGPKMDITDQVIKVLK